jgi:hypothetical protein
MSMMPMSFSWSYYCVFLWSDFYSTDNKKGMFTLGLIFSFFIAFFAYMSCIAKKVAFGQNKHLVIRVLAIGIEYLFHVCAMLLMMTYNYAVIIALVSGHIVAYLFNVFFLKSYAGDGYMK